MFESIGRPYLINPEHATLLLRAWDRLRLYEIRADLSLAETVLKQAIMAQLEINQLECTHPLRPRVFYFNNQQVYGCPVCRAVLSRS